MKTILLSAICSCAFLFSCNSPSNNEQNTSEWTEKQEINFYNDCKGKMIGQGEAEENANAFCKCCLLKLKEVYSNGIEAESNLTDDEIALIEADCSK